MLKEVKHENVIRLEGLMKTDNNYYLIYEYANAGTLGEYLANRRLTKELLTEVIK